jgi:hypothetical protein
VAKHCPEGSYHLRFRSSGKRVWENVGADSELATVALQRKNLELQAGHHGMTFAIELKSTQP